jgi:plastocyanin
MNINIFGSMFPKKMNRQFTLLAIVLICPAVLAKSVQITDQFGKPVENVVVSFTSDKPIQSGELDVLTMDQINKQFAPRVLVVQKNQTVIFPNSDNIRHHLYSFSKPKPFEFKMFKGGESEKLTFDQAGVVVLGCNIHDQMVGYIYVAENEYTTITDAQGIANIPSDQLIVRLWHSKLSANKVERKNVSLPSSSSGQPIPITLNLTAEVEARTTSKFKSKKFNRGNQ